MTANVIRIKWIDADACYKVSQPGWDGGNVVMEDDYIKLKAEFERLRALIEEASKLLCEAPLGAHEDTPAGCDVCDCQDLILDWHDRAIPSAPPLSK